jgi:hypothetical protein
VSLIEFWNCLHESGDLRVDAPGNDQSAADEAALCAGIEQVEAHWRLELAGEPPALLLPVAVWATQTMYRACQFLVYREVDPQTVTAALAIASGLPSTTPDVCYSADLALRVLPDVLALAKAASPDDPLVTALREIARRWPLSSVGEPLAGADVSPFIDHRALRQLYADRIIARGDASRLDDPRVAQSVREALGAHAADLAPAAVVSALMGEPRE